MGRCTGKLAVDDVAQTHNAVVPAEMFVNPHGRLSHHFACERQFIGHAKELANLECAGADIIVSLVSPKSRSSKAQEVKKLTLTGLIGGQPGT
jgi:hypothetical protein